jgi:hypothetical protein
MRIKQKCSEPKQQVRYVRRTPFVADRMLSTDVSWPAALGTGVHGHSNWRSPRSSSVSVPEAHMAELDAVVAEQEEIHC